eukprot:517411_1
MKIYQDIEFVDRGRFATVLKGRKTNANKNKYVALKKMWMKSSLNMNNTNSTSSYLLNCIEREIKILGILNNVNNKHIIKLLDTFIEDEYIIIVLEFMDIDLYQLLKKQSFNETECKYITKQLLEGLNVLHKNNIIHRDLKPANILFNKCGILKIADFGQACIMRKNNNSDSNLIVYGNGINKGINKKMNNLLTNEIGTRWYKSPELLYGTRKYDFSIDIWSVGCIIVEILQSKPLFCGETDIDQLCKIFNVLGTINLKYYSDAIHLPDFNKIIFNQINPKNFKILWPSFTNQLINLIKSCLQFNPNVRITADKTLRHMWFKQKQEKTLRKQLQKQFINSIVNATKQRDKQRKKEMENFKHNDEVIQ